MFYPIKSKNRELIVKLYLEKYSLGEICDRLGWSHRSIRKVTRILRKGRYQIPLLSGGERSSELTKSRIERMINS